MFKQIVTDLETAATFVKVTAANKGIVTKGAVNAMLAKVHATVSPADWTKVNKYCDDVIAGGYSLLPDFNSLWNNTAENTAESIFEINYEGGVSDGNWGVKIFRGLDWKKFNLPSNDLILTYDAEGDMIRKNASITFLDVSGKWSDIHYPQTKYPFINKYRKFEEGSAQNYIFIRLADILLLKAEAQNELGNLDEAKKLVNQIRKRVKLADTAAASKMQMKKAILHERRLELAFEGIRWFDLKRTGTAIEVMNKTKLNANGDLVGYNLTTNKLLWPIPQSELDKNIKLTQNSGY